MKATLQNHPNRMQRMLDHIAGPLDEDLPLVMLKPLLSRHLVGCWRQIRFADRIPISCLSAATQAKSFDILPPSLRRPWRPVKPFQFLHPVPQGELRSLLRIAIDRCDVGAMCRLRSRRDLPQPTPQVLLAFARDGSACEWCDRDERGECGRCCKVF